MFVFFLFLIFDSGLSELCVFLVKLTSFAVLLWKFVIEDWFFRMIICYGPRYWSVSKLPFGGNVLDKTKCRSNDLGIGGVDWLKNNFTGLLEGGEYCDTINN